MSEIGPISGNVTKELVSLALNAALARHNAIATNIANVNSEGFRPVHIRFDEQLALYQNRFVDRRFDGSAGRLIDSLKGSVTLAENTATEKVQLDSEVARMVQNAVHYQALLSAQGKMTAITRMAISGGR